MEKESYVEYNHNSISMGESEIVILNKPYALNKFSE
jgi:hypothetical protein